MVELDFQAGTARGLSRGARDAVRRTGRLPAGLVHPAVEQAWAAVNAAKAFEVKSATVADLLRARDAGWQMGQRSGWGAFGVKMLAPMPNDPECDCGWSAPVGAGDGCGEKVTDEHGEQEESKRASETFYTGSVSGAGRWVYKNSKCEFEYSCDAPCGCYEKGGDQELVGVHSGVSSHCPKGSAASCPDVDYHVVYDSGKGKCLAYAQCMKEGVPCGEPGKGWFPWGPEMAPCPKAATSSMSTGTRDACGGASGHAEDVSPATVGDARSIVEAGLWHDDDMIERSPNVEMDPMHWLRTEECPDSCWRGAATAQLRNDVISPMIRQCRALGGEWSTTGSFDDSRNGCAFVASCSVNPGPSEFLFVPGGCYCGPDRDDPVSDAMESAFVSSGGTVTTVTLCPYVQSTYRWQSATAQDCVTERWHNTITGDDSWLRFTPECT